MTILHNKALFFPLLLIICLLSVTKSFQIPSYTLSARRQPQNVLQMSSETTPSLDVSQFMQGDRPEGTQDYIMQQTMIRVKDPMKSLEFYCNVLGFKLVMYREFPQWQFNVYFVAPVSAADIPQGDEAAQWDFCMKTPGTIEITWNYGTEKQEGMVYNTGNADATGTQDGQKVKVRDRQHAVVERLVRISSNKSFIVCWLLLPIKNLALLRVDLVISALPFPMFTKRANDSKGWAAPLPKRPILVA